MAIEIPHEISLEAVVVVVVPLVLVLVLVLELVIGEGTHGNDAMT